MTFITLFVVVLSLILSEVRRYIAILLIAVFSLSTMFKLGLVAKYCINFEYYAKVLCINKDKPKMGCNGKCHLKKELKKTESTSDENLPEMVVKLQFSEYVLEENLLQFHKPIESKYKTKLHWQAYTESVLNGYVYSIFKPPMI